MSDLNNLNVSVENQNNVNQGAVVPPQAPQGNLALELIYTREARKQVREMCSWTRFLAIFGLISLILGVGFPLFSILKSGEINAITMGITCLLVVITLITLIPIRRLLKFSSQAKLGLKNNDSKQMELAMKSMNGYWRFVAVLAMLGLVIMMISFFITGAGFIAALFGSAGMNY